MSEKASKKSNKRIIPGIAGIVFAAMIGYIFYTYVITESIWIFSACLMLSIGIGIASLFYISKGFFGFITGFTAIISIFGLHLIPEELHEPYNIIFSVLLILAPAVFLYIYVRKVKKVKKRKNNPDNNKEVKAGCYVFSLHVMDDLRRYIQLVKTKSGFIVHVANFDPEKKISTDIIRITEEPQPCPGDKFIDVNDIKRVILKNSSHELICNLIIETSKGRYKYIISSEAEYMIKDFFADSMYEFPLYEFINKIKKATPEEKKAADPSDVQKIRNVMFSLSVYTIMIGIIWLLFDVPCVLFKNNSYIMISFALMLIPICVIYLYIRFCNIITLSRIDMKSAEYQKSHVSALLPLLVPGLVLAVSSISYFNFLSYTKLIIYSIIIAGGVCALFFTLSGEYKWRRNVLAVIIIFAVLYAPSVIAQLNYAFDSPEPNHVNAKVTEILYDSDYDLKADLNDGTEISYKFKVLGNYEVGDTIDIVKKEGFFDIPYADEGFKQLQLIFNRNFVLILNDAMMEKLGPMSLEDQLINESQKIKNKS